MADDDPIDMARLLVSHVRRVHGLKLVADGPGHWRLFDRDLELVAGSLATAERYLTDHEDHDEFCLEAWA